MSVTPSVPSCVDETPATDETPSMDDPPCASGVVTSVPACVLPSTPCVKGAPQLGGTTCAREAARVCESPCVDEAPQAKETAGASNTARVCEARCVDETPRVSAPVGVSGVVSMCEARCVNDRPCVKKTVCVRSLYTREMSVAMCEHAAASPDVRMNGNVNGNVCSLGLVARRCARDAWRQRLRLWRAKCRVAAVVVFETVPGLHGRARVVRAVPRTRPREHGCEGKRPGPETHAVD